MSREEDAIRATTRAIAATVRDVPPLELEPAPGELWSPRRGTRRTRRRGSGPRWLPWLAPLAAAAVVVAVAVALVLVRGNPNEGAVPQPAPTSSLPGDVPRYYVAVKPVRGTTGEVNHLLVGDALTGQTIDDITPPAHVSYDSVTAAADDRTFLIFATESGGSRTTGRWYILHLAPGTENVIRLSSTALGPESGVVASAVSGSGSYLAVAEDGPAKGQQRVVVFSVASGRPLRGWSTNDAPDLWALGVTSQQNLLTWTNGDRAIAFAAYDQATGAQSVRTLNVGGPPDGDLIADSRLIWSTSANTPAQCGFTPPVLSADGRTIACVTTDIRPLPTGDSQWTLTWFASRASAQAPAADNYTIAYQVIRQANIAGAGAGMNFAGLADALWVSPSGSALIGEWAIAASPQATTSTSSTSSSGSRSVTATLPLGVSAGSVHVGVISHGTFTPLRLPPDILPLTAQAIAW